MDPVRSSGSRLHLRELAREEVNAVLAVYGSPEATEHQSFEPRSREQVAQMASRSVASATATLRTEYVVAVIERDTAELVGSAELT
ncbi:MULTISPECIES: GNAT family N-acetyltransferase [unclassified Streptomyces]|uniref:GNAT family N-acetyltransferase n=1 Tax=unclassified Streptomyces TaxID=2593676 RepID=UPI003654AED1